MSAAMPVRTQTSEFFDQAAASWSDRYTRDASFRRRLQAILEAATPMIGTGREILDFGCGAGDLSTLLAQRDCRVTGTDISTAMLDVARQRSSGNFVQLDGDRPTLPFIDGSFDGCIASSVLEYVPQPRATLAEIARVLKAGGHFVMTVPDPDHPVRRKEAWLRRLLNLPGLGVLLAATRWREGAAYLQISRNRPPLAEWRAILRDLGFADVIIRRSDLTLAIVTGRKTP
jgi:ubiquinone/menaquinone biosynthesis C-methylase UbiE